jgi:Cu2+-exporting ATPase
MSISESVLETAKLTDTRIALECFHCGLPVPKGVDHSVVIDGIQHPLCCRGCEAVAQAIVAAGLTDFYHHRTGPSRRAEDLIPRPLQGLELYDRPDLQKSFVRAAGEHSREASLILEGIACAACIWLNERHVSALPGVLEFRVNYSTHRAQVKWDEREIHLSDILGAIAAIGYRAHPFDPHRQEIVQKNERATALRRIAVAGLGAMQVMMLAVAMYAGDYYGMDEALRHFLRWISLIITVPVVLYSAIPFFTAAWRGLRLWQLGMDVPVSLAIAGGFTVSVWSTWQGGGEVYFDSVTMFIFFLLSGRFLEMTTRHRANQISEELVRLLPATATRLRADDAEEGVAVAELIAGDRVLVRPGETIPADGRVLAGTSCVDEALLTGESMPIPKAAGEPLVGGSVNRESPLVMRVEKVGAETVLSSMVRLLDRAQSEKPRIALLADRVATWFVTGVLVIAALVAWWWWQHTADNTAFRITLAVLVVTCPCALSLATPVAIAAATSSLTRLGLLVTRGHALETLARATHVVFDKTGTLTYGRLRLSAVVPLRNETTQRCLEWAAALEHGSEHPVGRALVDATAWRGQATELRNTPGKGVEGRIEGVRYRLGQPEFVASLSATTVTAAQEGDPAASWVALGDEQGLLAWFKLEDTLRPDAVETVAALRTLGLEVLLLSGDRPETVATIARRVSIPYAEGGLLPQDKLERIKTLQAEGAVVAMIGDGINDAPVLAAAQVSIAMESGTQLAHASADTVLLSGRLGYIVQGIKTARRTLTIIRQNFAWAITYNLVALPLAATGWLAPWVAALGMSLSSLLVVANALRLKQGRAATQESLLKTDPVLLERAMPANKG